MDGFISLPRARIHKKEPTKKLNNLPGNFAESFYKDWLNEIDFSGNTDFQQSIVNKTPSEDIKKFLLATSDFGNEIQGELNLYGTDGKLNSASFRRKYDPISKNVIRNQNPKEFLFKDLKHFDTQDPVIGNLIKQIDIGKKKDLSKILKGTPDIIDLELRSRLNKLRDDETFNPDGNNNNNNLPSPPAPSFFAPSFGPDQLAKPPPSPTNSFRATTPSNRVFPPQRFPTINTQIDFLTNTVAISESSQINDFLTLLPEIPNLN